MSKKKAMLCSRVTAAFNGNCCDCVERDQCKLTKEQRTFYRLDDDIKKERAKNMRLFRIWTEQVRNAMYGKEEPPKRRKRSTTTSQSGNNKQS